MIGNVNQIVEEFEARLSAANKVIVQLRKVIVELCEKSLSFYERDKNGLYDPEYKAILKATLAGQKLMTLYNINNGKLITVDCFGENDRCYLVSHDKLEWQVKEYWFKTEHEAWLYYLELLKAWVPQCIAAKNCAEADLKKYSQEIVRVSNLLENNHESVN